TGPSTLCSIILAWRCVAHVSIQALPCGPLWGVLPRLAMPRSLAATTAPIRLMPRSPTRAWRCWGLGEHGDAGGNQENPDSTQFSGWEGQAHTDTLPR